MSEEKRSGDEYLFEIASFLISSARGCLSEPKVYGPLRLLTAFSKLASFPDFAPGLKRDEFLLALSKDIDERIIYLTMSDPEAFEKALKELSIKLGKEIRNRKIKKRKTNDEP